MKHRWYGIEVRRAQRGWIAEVDGSIETHRQFTDERHTAETGDSKWLWVAVWRAFHNWRAAVKHLQAIPGPFNVRGRGDTMRTCEGCKYWSEMLAHAGSDTGGEVVAMCLSPSGPQRRTYVRLHCAAYQTGDPVDAPGAAEETP